MKHYISIARPDHWIKNVLMVVGTMAACIVSPELIGRGLISPLILAICSTCLIASSNYVINEICDAPYDVEHPDKKLRPIPSGEVNLLLAYAEWIVLGAAGLGIAWLINYPFFLSGLGLWIMGLIYNISPVRSKDIPVIDVLSEAVNNPLRLLLGWYATGLMVFPPSSLVISYWLFGAFLMTGKRLGEYRRLTSVAEKNIILYRKSFKYYSNALLVTFMVIYSSGFMFFFAVLMTKYHPEFILSGPALMGLMGYTVYLAYQPNSILQTPERLFYKPLFLIYTLGTFIFIVFLATVNIPFIHEILGISGKPW
jgi:4-hydroxybenzoate polyprenyltransferase